MRVADCISTIMSKYEGPCMNGVREVGACGGSRSHRLIHGRTIELLEDSEGGDVVCGVPGSLTKRPYINPINPKPLNP